MKRSLSIESARQRVCHPATLVTPSSADQAFVDNRESTTIQRHLMGIMANSPQANAQRLIRAYSEIQRSDMHCQVRIPV